MLSQMPYVPCLYKADMSLSILSEEEDAYVFSTRKPLAPATYG